MEFAILSLIGGTVLYKYLNADAVKQFNKEVLHKTDLEINNSNLISNFEKSIENKSFDEIEHPKYIDYPYSKHKIQGKTKGSYTDVNKEFKDLCTTFVTEQFFKSQDSMFNFL